MKNKVLLLGLMIAILVTFSTCKLNDYLAYVTIYNIGEFPVLASVDDSTVTINPDEYETWQLELEDDQPVVVELYAEIVGEPEYNDEKTITIADGEVFPWLVGWYAEAGIKKRAKAPFNDH
jgi:hypothetical protein